jgi:Leucine-rich repeat (LRR) protein
MSSRFRGLACILCVAAAMLLLTLSCSKKSTGIEDDEETRDGIAPSTVSDLTVKSVTPSSVTLGWTAPGDDTTSGTTTLYDIRYSKTNNLWSEWDSATHVTGEPSPKPAGSAESMTITGLMEDSTYYFALQAADEDDNWSFISNVASATCIQNMVVNFPDTNLEKVIRDQLNRPSGDIHRLDLQAIVDLWAEAKGIVNLSGLGQCTNLAALTLIDNQISDVSELSSLNKLKVLNLAINQVTDLDPLSGLTGLEQLHLSQNQIQDITPLAGLSNLRQLRLGWNQIEDLSPLSGLVDLGSLDLTGNSVADIEPLVSNTGLGTGDEVWLTNNQLSFQSVNVYIPALLARGAAVHWDLDVTPPAAVTDLWVQSVSASSATLVWTAPGDDGISGKAYQYEIRCASDSSVAAGWGGATIADTVTCHSAGTIETFEVTGLETDSTCYFALKTEDESANWSEGSNVVKTTPFADVVFTFPDTGLESAVEAQFGKPGQEIHKSELLSLQELKADSMGIADLTGLEQCVNIRILSLANNQISGIGALASLTKLEDLNLSQNQISEIDALAGLTVLWNLNLRDNQIGDIDPLSGLTDLQYLFCSSNPFSDVEPLAGLTKLVNLELMNNEIGDIGPLSGLINLQFLFIWGEDISDVTPLAGLTKLRVVYVEFNDVSDVSPFSGLTALEQLYLRSNNISDISPLLLNSGLGSGDKVGLNQNPLSEDSKNTYIPTLQTRGVTVYYDP